jgi:hypothetical protein
MNMQNIDAISVDEAIRYLIEGERIAIKNDGKYCEIYQYLKCYVSSLRPNIHHHQVEHAIGDSIRLLSKDGKDITIYKIIKTPLQEAFDLLDEKDSDTEELLPDLLRGLSYEDKLELMGDILCEEWYLQSDFEFIKSVLDIFAKSIK